MMWKHLRKLIWATLDEIGCDVEYDDNGDLLVTRKDGTRTIISFYEYTYRIVDKQ